MILNYLLNPLKDIHFIHFFLLNQLLEKTFIKTNQKTFLGKNKNEGSLITSLETLHFLPILYIFIVFPITKFLLFCKFYINRNKKTATKFSEKSHEKYILKLLLISHIPPIYQDAGHAERTKNQDTPFSTFVPISIHCILDGESRS